MKRVVKMDTARLALATVGACSKEAVKPSNDATTTPKNTAAGAHRNTRGPACTGRSRCRRHRHARSLGLHAVF